MKTKKEIEQSVKELREKAKRTKAEWISSGCKRTKGHYEQIMAHCDMMERELKRRN